MDLFLAFLAGTLVMDLLWAWRLGIIQAKYHSWCRRPDPLEDWTED